MGRGQAWSIDLIFGVLVFLVAIAIIYALLIHKDKGDTGPLRIESEVIANKLASDPQLKVADNNQLDPAKLGTLANMDYDELRTRLGVDREFCIYLQDEAGNLIFIQGADGHNYTGIGSGSGELNLSGTECGKARD